MYHAIMIAMHHIGDEFFLKPEILSNVGVEQTFEQSSIDAYWSPFYWRNIYDQTNTKLV